MPSNFRHRFLASVFFCCICNSITFAEDVNMPALLQHEMHYDCADGIQALQKTDKGKRFLNMVFADQELMLEFQCAGIPQDSYSKTLERLFTLHEANPDFMTKGVFKRLAVAAAFQCAPPNDAKKDGLAAGHLIPKYRFFSDSFNKKILHPSFARLHAPNMRFLFQFGAPEDLEYAQSHFNVPLSEFSKIHGEPAYNNYNEFGSSIHSDDFRKPYYEAGMGRIESILNQGAVCGGKSFLASVHALSRGVPGLIVSAKGHCAYMLRLPGEGWIRCYGGRSGGGCSDAVFGGNSSFFLLMEDELFRNFDTHIKSMTYLWQAHSATSIDKAESFYEKALEIQPENYAVWYDRIQVMLKREPACKLSSWDSLLDKIIAAYKDSPGIILKLATLFVPEVYDDQQTARRYVKAMRGGNWKGDTSRDLVMFMRFTYKHARDTVDRKLFRELLFTAFADTPLLGSMIEHMEENICRKKNQKAELNKLLKKILSDGGKVSPGVQRLLVSKFLAEAQKSRDVAAFSEFAKKGNALLNEQEKAWLKGVKKMTPFSGHLLSKGGLISSGQMSNKLIFLHAGTLEESGGYFKFSPSDKDFVNIELGKPGVLSGIIFQGTPRGKGNLTYTVSTSEDGKSWKIVDKKTQLPEVWRIDLAGKRIRARYVRLSCHGSSYKHMSVEIKRFAVYGDGKK